jgi:hypothetical protein
VPAVRRPVAAASRRTVHRASTPTRTHAAPTVAKHAPAVVSKAAATKHGKSAGAGHERSTEAAEVGGAKETRQAKQEKQSTGRAGERSRRPDVSPAASSSPKGTVAVPDEPSGDETNAGGDQGGGLKKGRSEAAVALEDVASASAAAEPAALKRGNANAKDTGE